MNELEKSEKKSHVKLDLCCNTALPMHQLQHLEQAHPSSSGVH